MENPNEMMDLVWLLNVADNSAFEVRGLLHEFLEQKQRLQEVAHAIADNETKREFLKKEIARNVKSFQELHVLLDSVLQALLTADATMNISGATEALSTEEGKADGEQ